MITKNAKELIKKCAVAVLLVLLLPAILVITGLSIKPCYAETYYAELGDMVSRMDNAAGKKLIVLGNSDVAFGLNVKDLEKTLSDNGLSYTVCPLGLYAAVGTAAMLEVSRAALSEGDVVVLVVEPSSETLSTYFGATAYLKCSESASWLLSRVNGEQKKALLGNAVTYLQDRYAIKTSGILPSTDNVYQKSAFDESCDMVYDRPGNIMQLGFDTTEPIDLAGVSVDEDFAALVRDYCEFAASKGASVFVSFSPMNRSAVKDTSEEAVKAYFTAINEAFPCTVISDPNKYIFDSGWFYDSNLHLNNAGAILRTEQLAEDVCAALGVYAAIERTAVEMPASAYVAEKTEGDEDAFLYTVDSFDSYYVVSGLTDKGKTAQKLSVPSEYNEKPVTGFEKGALDSAENLVELTLPDSIASLPDELFKNCGKLERLVLLHKTDLPALSESALSGAEDLRIYVPKEAYSLYRDGVGCGINTWEGYIDRIYTY